MAVSARALEAPGDAPRGGVPEAPGGVWAPGRRRLTVGLVLTITMFALEALSVATVLPEVSDDLGGVRLYGWVFSAFFLTSLIGTVLAGAAADRIGLGRPFAAGMALFAAGLAIAGFAPSMLVVVAGRAIQGLGAGVVPALAYVSLGRGYPESIRPKMLFVLSSAWVVPGLLGPGLSAIVAETVGWRWVFLGLLPVVVVGTALALPPLAALGSGEGDDGGARPTPDGSAARLVPALSVAAGAGLVLGGLGSGSAFLAVPLVVAGVALGLPAFSRLVPIGTLVARPGLPAAVAVRGVLTFAFFAADAYVPYLVADVRGASVGLGGAVVTTATLSWTAGAFIQSRTVQRVGARRLVGTGFGFVVAGAALLATVLSDSVPLVVAFPAWLLAGLGMGLAYAPLSLVVLSSAEPGSEGAATAGLQLSDVLGTALGAGVGGAAVAAGEALGWSVAAGPAIAFSLAGVVGALGIALSRRLPSGRQTPSP